MDTQAEIRKLVEELLDKVNAALLREREEGRFEVRSRLRSILDGPAPAKNGHAKVLELPKKTRKKPRTAAQTAAAKKNIQKALAARRHNIRERKLAEKTLAKAKKKK